MSSVPQSVSPTPNVGEPFAPALLVVAAFAAACVWIVEGGLVAAAVLLGGVCLALAVAVTGAAATVASCALLLAPPGLIGENSALVAGVALLALSAMFTLGRKRQADLPFVGGRVPWLMALMAVAFPLGYLLGSYSLSFALSSAALWSLAAGAVVAGSGRASFVAQTARALALLVASLSVSYFISAATGFPGGAATFNGSSRDATVYFPFTLIRGNTGSLFDLPRFSVVAGEPGLGALFILVALWASARFYSGKARAALVCVLVTAGVFTQSTGFLFAIVGFTGVVLVRGIWRRSGFVAGAFVGLVLLPVAVITARVLLASKREGEGYSLADRGFEGGQAVGEINLLSAFHHTPHIAILVVGLLVALAWEARGGPLELALVAAIAVTGIFAQPIHLHPGIWLATALCVCIAAPATRPAPPAVPTATV